MSRRALQLASSFDSKDITVTLWALARLSAAQEGPGEGFQVDGALVTALSEQVVSNHSGRIL